MRNKKNKRMMENQNIFTWCMFALLWLDRVRADPCPKETPLYGGAQLDGSSDEYEEYFVVADDDLTRIT